MDRDKRVCALDHRRIKHWNALQALVPIPREEGGRIVWQQRVLGFALYFRVANGLGTKLRRYLSEVHIRKLAPRNFLGKEVGLASGRSGGIAEGQGCARKGFPCQAVEPLAIFITVTRSFLGTLLTSKKVKIFTRVLSCFTDGKDLVQEDPKGEDLKLNKIYGNTSQRQRYQGRQT